MSRYKKNMLTVHLVLLIVEDIVLAALTPRRGKNGSVNIPLMWVHKDDVESFVTYDVNSGISYNPGKGAYEWKYSSADAYYFKLLKEKVLKINEEQKTQVKVKLKALVQKLAQDFAPRLDRSEIAQWDLQTEFDMIPETLEEEHEACTGQRQPGDPTIADVLDEDSDNPFNWK